jgi:hypothetical protein
MNESTFRNLIRQIIIEQNDPEKTGIMSFPLGAGFRTGRSASNVSADAGNVSAQLRKNLSDIDMRDLRARHIQNCVDILIQAGDSKEDITLALGTVIDNLQ